MKMSKSTEFGTATEAENTQLLIIRYEQALTKIQEAKRRALDSLHKMEFDKNDLIMKNQRMMIKNHKEVLKELKS